MKKQSLKAYFDALTFIIEQRDLLKLLKSQEALRQDCESIRNEDVKDFTITYHRGQRLVSLSQYPNRKRYKRIECNSAFHLKE